MSKKVLLSKKKQRSETQILFAQYFTPEPIASYMSSMFRDYKYEKINILDPGAGEGILGLSLLRRLKSSSIKATFVELDESTSQVLRSRVSSLPLNVEANIVNDDFIKVGLDLERANKTFSHIILNPPYFKLRVDNPNSTTLRQNGIHITNIYAAFVWLSARLLMPDGQLVAIIPRSFCNGPYFLKFREYIINNFSLDGIHIFNSRNKAFSKDSVLQENVILHISKRKQIKDVKITYSTDQTFNDVKEKSVSVDVILNSNDSSKTIHIPGFNQANNLADTLNTSLQDLSLMVSTGPLVDFRLKDRITPVRTSKSIPLLYPSHMAGHLINWPLPKINKDGQHYIPQYDSRVSLPLEGLDVQKLDRNILPLDGHYVVVRRFSSKEEKRRIFASVVNPDEFEDSYITFENHLNYFHVNKHGMEKELAYGICAFLNSSILDEHFRKVSGHTQVNVSDLKRMPYPSLSILRKFGRAMYSIDGLIDDIVSKEIFGKIHDNHTD